MKESPTKDENTSSQTLPSGGCFAGADKIIFLNHGSKKFSDISNTVDGESLLSFSFASYNKSRTQIFSKLKSWIHFDSKVRISFLFIQLEDSHFLHITPDHLIYKSGYNDVMNLTRAANVRVGDHLYVRYGDSLRKRESKSTLWQSEHIFYTKCMKSVCRKMKDVHQNLCLCKENQRKTYPEQHQLLKRKRQNG
uniref:Hint domain-containing protein n=1 Tax=Romanomermis culicivorax TaxID=13658 RepID=A0A915I3L0_ROMCU